MEIEGQREREREKQGEGAWREEAGKPIGGRKSGYEVKRQEQVKKRRNKAGREREQVERKCENMRLWELHLLQAHPREQQ